MTAITGSDLTLRRKTPNFFLFAMRPGYLYVLSNPSLLPDVYKIGLARGDQDSVEGRRRRLSSSSAIPTNFKLEFGIPVGDVDTAERRVHLLLDPKRINPSKEFFKVDLLEAKATCEAIAEYEREDGSISDHIGLTHRLSGAHYFHNTKTSPTAKKFINALIGATTNNTLFDRIIKQRRGIVDGFLTPQQVAAHLGVGERAASSSARRFAYQGMTLSCHQLHEPPIEPIFDFIRCHKGHLAWQFTDEFREHFSNPKF